MTWVVLFVGGGVGTLMRYLAGRLAFTMFGMGFPVGTFIINISGSFLMGLLAAWFARHDFGGATFRLFLMTGVLGGFTTFSAFSLEALTLWQRQQAWSAALYVAASVVLSLAAVACGWTLSKWLAG